MSTTTASPTQSTEEKKASTTTVSGSVAVLEAILAEGVNTIFGYPGGAIMPIYDALYDYQETLKHILVRHEQGGIHAAQGFARTSGNVGVVFATSGPGATNLVTGLADAMIDSTPVVCHHRPGVCAPARYRCFPGNRCDQYHHTGYQMELPGNRCYGDPRSDGESFLYRAQRPSRPGADRHHQKCTTAKIRIRRIQEMRAYPQLSPQTDHPQGVSSKKRQR